MLCVCPEYLHHGKSFQVYFVHLINLGHEYLETKNMSSFIKKISNKIKHIIIIIIF